MKIGWVRIHRKIEDNPIWLSEKFTRGQAWVDLLLLAAHKKTYFFVRGIRIDVERGQLAWSIESLAKRWAWSKEKTIKYLILLTKEGMIAKKVVNRISTYTVLNYEKHQSDRLQTSTQTDHKPVHKPVTYNNDKNIKNVKNVKKEYIYNNFFLSFLEDFNKRFQSEYRPTKTLNELYNLRRNTFKAEEITKALRNLTESDYHMGKNDTGWKATPEFLLRTDETMDKFLNLNRREVGEDVDPSKIEF